MTACNSTFLEYTNILKLREEPSSKLSLKKIKSSRKNERLLRC
jgi:hypothetical protein